MGSDSAETQTYFLNNRVHTVINGIFLNQGRLLLIGKEKGRGKYWIPVGGKKGLRESDLDCLDREVREELCGNSIHPFSLRFYDVFEGISPIEAHPAGGDLGIYVFAYHALLRSDNIRTSNEAKGFRWVGKGDLDDPTITPITRNMMIALERDGYLL